MQVCKEVAPGWRDLVDLCDSGGIRWTAVRYASVVHPPLGMALEFLPHRLKAPSGFYHPTLASTSCSASMKSGQCHSEKNDHKSVKRTTTTSFDTALF